MMAKVFAIGFQKCGTTTLGVMLSNMDYRVAGYRPFRDLAARSDLQWSHLEKRALSVMATHDAAKDTPWPLLYPVLDREFPGAKFIHVIRDPDTWIKSAVRDFADHPNMLHQLIYGASFPKGNEDAWLDRYQQHNTEVAAYFADRPADYLQLRLKDLSYDRICPFLGKPVLSEPPPMANTRLKKSLKMVWWKTQTRLRRLSLKTW